MSEFEYDDVVYDWDDYTLGETVKFKTDMDDADGPWRVGTVVRIDYDDSSLPWGVTSEVIPDVQVENDGEYPYIVTDLGYDWIRPDAIRKSDYLIEEEDDDLLAI